MRAVRCLPEIDYTLLSRTDHYDPAPAGLEPRVDTFKAGDPDSRVNGIAVTMMATLDVLQRAAAHGDNLIITMSRSAGAATVSTAQRLRPFGRHHAVHGWSAEPAPPRYAFLLRGLIRCESEVMVIAAGLPAFA